MRDLEFEPLNESDALEIEDDLHLGPSVPEVAPGAAPSPDFRAQIHDRPVAVSIKDMMSAANAAAAAKIYKRFDLWLVPHRFSIRRVSGSSKIVKAGCDVEYFDTDQTFSILGLVPAPEFVDRLAANLDFEASAKALLTESGALEFALPLPADLGLKPVSGSASLSTSISLQGGFKVALSLKMVTPFVAAIGVGSRQCMFEFSAHNLPLSDRDIETWALVALPKGEPDIAFRMRCFYSSRRIAVPRHWRTAWTEVTATASR
jgi:hypothetical protein